MTIAVVWSRPGTRRDGTSHAFQETTLEDGSTTVRPTALCGKTYQSSSVTKARAFGNTSSIACPICKAKNHEVNP